MPVLICEICLQEALEPHWANWFEGLELTTSAAGGTLLRGPVPDKAALHGLLNRIYDLNLTLTGIRCIEPAAPNSPGAPYPAWTETTDTSEK